MVATMGSVFYGGYGAVQGPSAFSHVPLPPLRAPPWVLPRYGNLVASADGAYSDLGLPSYGDAGGRHTEGSDRRHCGDARRSWVLPDR